MTEIEELELELKIAVKFKFDHNEIIHLENLIKQKKEKKKMTKTILWIISIILMACISFNLYPEINKVPKDFQDSPDSTAR